MAKGADLEKAYGLIIGIAEYKDPRIPGLKYTHADAEGIFKLLTDPKKLGLSKDKIRILLDRDATQFNIKNAISSWLFKNADEDSVVLIFFAGHGGVEEDRLGLEKDNLAKYLLPYDTVLEDLFSSAISNRDFNDLLLTIRSKKLVIFMDSCYSGGVSERKARDVKIAEDPYQKLAEGKGRIVIAASQPNQHSFEDSRIGHGVFTYNLLEALSGKADLDNDGYVTVLDAYKYVQDAVPRDAMKLAGGKQEPILRGDITKDFVISIDRERFEKIEIERVLEEKLGILQNFYDDGKLSGKQYEYLRAILKIEPGELKDKNKKTIKRINDLLSGNISIPTFLEELKGLEPELFGIPEEEERKYRKKQIEREEKERIEGQKEQPKVQLKEKGSSYNKLLVTASVLVILLLGYWMIAPGLSNSSKIPDTTQPTPTAVAATSYPAPIITSTTDKKTITNSIGTEFVLIPAGEFNMGLPSNDPGRFDDEGPLHHVKISKAFYMSKYEVTQKQWRDVMGNNPSEFKGDNLPVEQVSWEDAQNFIKKLNDMEGTNKYRLPSEAEWEYAARAGTTTRYSFGNDESELGNYAWYYTNSNSRTHEIGQKNPNPWGLYDMIGNVYEWVQDKYHDSYNGAPTDGSSWESGFGSTGIFRGGGFACDAKGCWPTTRHILPGSPLGFRLLRDL